VCLPASPAHLLPKLCASVSVCGDYAVTHVAALISSVLKLNLQNFGVKATTEPSGIIPNQSACCYCCIAYRHADGGKQSHAALSQGHNVLKHGCENTSAGERWPLREEEATAVCAVHISKFQHYRLKITTVLFLFIFRVGSRYIPLH